MVIDRRTSPARVCEAQQARLYRLLSLCFDLVVRYLWTSLIWRVLLAVYELFVSVVKPRKHYTYDLYTALEHTGLCEEKRTAVGITQGLVWADQGQPQLKSWREEHFPLELVDCGVSFKCQEGAASVVADKDKIIAEIADRQRH